MKKIIFYSVAVIILILIVSIWAYLFMFGVPKNSSEVFARFGAGNDAEITILPENTNIDVSDIDSNNTAQALKQLTTRPVAGAGFVGNDIRYVEQGTGHVYNINLITGEETIISGATIPGAREAIFSDESSYVAITMDDEGSEKTLVGKLALGTQFSGVSLPLGAKNIAFVNASGTLEYTLNDGSNTHGYSYNMLKDVDAMVFELPLRDVNVLWGNPTYVYTTPTTKQEGYLYQVIKNNLHFITEGNPSLMGFLAREGTVVSQTNENKFTSYLITPDGKKINQPLPYIPEKCTSGDGYTYCAVPRAIIDTGSFPDAWYMGLISFTDVLWNVDLNSGKAISLVDFLETSKREIDVSKIGADREGKRVYFINKNDNTLWLFDTTL